jgi:rubrerythrin
MSSDGGKGSARRKEDVSKIHENWDRIFGKKKEETSMIDEHDDPQERSDEDYERSEEEWTCDVCGGPMYSAPHWSYGQCDDCGARQELINDDYT